MLKIRNGFDFKLPSNNVTDIEVLNEIRHQQTSINVLNLDHIN